MSFEQLVHVCKLGLVGNFHTLVFEWQAKREHLAIHVQDLPKLVDDFRGAQREPYERNPMITLIDPIPRIRLSSGCEAVVNCLYGMAEIAAQFANKVSAGMLPASFNAIRKKVEHGEFSETGLTQWVNDFEWYRKVREIRTEWAHHSTITIGEIDGAPLVVVRCLRRPSDRQEFRQDIHIGIAELIDWIRRAISVVDGLGNYLLVNHIIPKLDPSANLVLPKRDAASWPIIKADHRVDVEELSVRDYLAQVGIVMAGGLAS